MNEANHAADTGQRSMRLSTGQTDENDRKRAFAALLSPALALVAGIGMGEDDKRAWLAAAYHVLQHLPEDLLREGVASAMMQADHPSKIVALISKAVSGRHEARLERLRRDAIREREHREQLEANRQMALPNPDPEIVQSTAEILARAWPSMRDHDTTRRSHGLDPDRECRAPSAADYERLFGVKIPTE